MPILLKCLWSVKRQLQIFFIFQPYLFFHIHNCVAFLPWQTYLLFLIYVITFDIVHICAPVQIPCLTYTNIQLSQDSSVGRAADHHVTGAGFNTRPQLNVAGD